MPENLMKKAVRIAGGLNKLSAMVGEPYQNVQKWVIRGRPPFCKALAVEEAVGGAIRRHDFYPAEYTGYEPESEPTDA